MKAKKLFASIAVLAMVLTCVVALAACNGNGSANSYSMTIDGAKYADYVAEHELPFLTGQGGAIFGFDSWIASGTKVNFDDDGNPIGCFWKFQLDVEDSIVANHVDYVMTYYFHGEPSDLYDNPIDAVYKFYGLGYKIEGGYHLYVANFAEATITLNCAVETPGWPENGDTGEGEGVFVRLEGPNGTIYYHYCNSDIQAAGGHYGFPFMSNLTQGFSECNVLVKGSEITGFDKITGNKAVVVEGGSSDGGMGELPGGPMGPGGPEGPGDDDDNDDEPNWEDAVVGNLTGEYTWKHEVAGLTSSAAWTATLTLKADGTLILADNMDNTEGAMGPTSETYDGTYKVLEKDGVKYILISGLIKTGEGPGAGEAPSAMGSVGKWAGTTGEVIVVLGENNTFTVYAA